MNKRDMTNPIEAEKARVEARLERAYRRIDQGKALHSNVEEHEVARRMVKRHQELMSTYEIKL